MKHKYEQAATDFRAVLEVLSLKERRRLGSTIGRIAAFLGVKFDEVGDLFDDQRGKPPRYEVYSTMKSAQDGWDNPMSLSDAATCLELTPKALLQALARKPNGTWYSPRRTYQHGSDRETRSCRRLRKEIESPSSKPSRLSSLASQETATRSSANLVSGREAVAHGE